MEKSPGQLEPVKNKYLELFNIIKEENIKEGDIIEIEFEGEEKPEFIISPEFVELTKNSLAIKYLRDKGNPFAVARGLEELQTYLIKDLTKIKKIEKAKTRGVLHRAP